MNPVEKYKYYLDEASKYANLYGISIANMSYGGRWDAFRHTFASALMTREFGAAIANTAGYTVEIAGYVKAEYANDKDYSILSANMDLYNNSIGRNIIVKYGEKLSNSEIAGIVFSELQNGNLITNFKIDTRIDANKLKIGDFDNKYSVSDADDILDSLNPEDKQIVAAMWDEDQNGMHIRLDDDSLIGIASNSLDGLGNVISGTLTSNDGNMLDSNTTFLSSDGNLLGNIKSFDPDIDLVTQLQLNSTSALLEAFQGSITQSTLEVAGVATSAWAYNDSNLDGKLDASDEKFSKFKIWQDMDCDELLVA